MSNRLQSHPSTATCPTAPSLEPDEPAPAQPQPAVTRSGSDAPRPRADARMLDDGFEAEFAASSGSRESTLFGRSVTIDTELDSVSVSATAAQATAQASVVRFGLQSHDRGHSFSAEAFSVKASSGAINPDGSIGRNVSLTATTVGAEITLTHSGNSVTFGAGAGIGGEFSIGTRDFDKDKRPELCARGSVGVFTVGFCVENPL
jgi:hypothetical protein